MAGYLRTSRKWPRHDPVLCAYFFSGLAISTYAFILLALVITLFVSPSAAAFSVTITSIVVLIVDLLNRWRKSNFVYACVVCASVLILIAAVLVAVMIGTLMVLGGGDGDSPGVDRSHALVFGILVTPMLGMMLLEVLKVRRYVRESEYRDDLTPPWIMRFYHKIS